LPRKLNVRPRDVSRVLGSGTRWASAAQSACVDQGVQMGLGVSIFLIAVGAILAFAVTATTSGVNLVTVGWVLMAVGALGLFLSMLFWSTWGGVGSSRRRTTVVEQRDADVI
jgi:hypothetical protein